MLKNIKNMELMNMKELQQDYKEYNECEYKELYLTEKEYIRNEKIVKDILEFLEKYGMLDDDIIIFYNEKRLDLSNGDFRKFDYDCYGSFCCGGYSNDKTVTMVFEGTFYNIMNGFCDGQEWLKISDEFWDLINKYNLYFEMGNAFNLSLYE